MCRLFQIFSHGFFRNGIPGRKSLTFHYAILLVEDMLHWWYRYIHFLHYVWDLSTKMEDFLHQLLKAGFWKIKSKQTIRYVSQGGTPQISFNWVHFHSKKSPTGPIERTPQPEYLIALASNLRITGSVGIRSYSIFWWIHVWNGFWY